MLHMVWKQHQQLQVVVNQNVSLEYADGGKTTEPSKEHLVFSKRGKAQVLDDTHINHS